MIIIGGVPEKCLNGRVKVVGDIRKRKNLKERKNPKGVNLNGVNPKGVNIKEINLKEKANPNCVKLFK